MLEFSFVNLCCLQIGKMLKSSLLNFWFIEHDCTFREIERRSSSSMEAYYLFFETLSIQKKIEIEQ